MDGGDLPRAIDHKPDWLFCILYSVNSFVDPLGCYALIKELHLCYFLEIVWMFLLCFFFFFFKYLKLTFYLYTKTETWHPPPLAGVIPIVSLCFADSLMLSLFSQLNYKYIPCLNSGYHKFRKLDCEIPCSQLKNTTY